MNVFELQTWVRAVNAPGSSEIAVDGQFTKELRAAMLFIVDQYADNRRPAVKEWPDVRLSVAFEQYIMRTIGGLAAGPIDGIPGPVTEKARKHWERGNWRSETLRKLPGDERFPRSLGRWPSYDKVVEFFGEPGTRQVKLHLPFPMRLAWDPARLIHSTRCHEAVHDPLRQIWADTMAHYGLVQIQRLNLHHFGGCFEVRPMRGSSRLSLHSWGIAWDVDPVRNALRMDRKRATLARPEYKPFWDIVTAAGATSLGKARDYDWMHFQFSAI